MGSPIHWYKKSLQYFAHDLIYEKNKQLAEQMLETDTIEILEKAINEQKVNISNNEFFFEAGQIYDYIIHEAIQTGNDCLNAANIGLIKFEEFIGLE